MNKMKRTLSIIIICLLCFTHSLVSGNYKGHEQIRIWSAFTDKKINKWKSELTIFTVDKSKTNHSAIIICPGGSYAYLGMKGEGYEVAEWLNSLGFTAYVLRYRVGWQGYHYPAAIQDLQRSIQIIRENAKKWDINPNFVGVIGFSAGGHLAGTSAIYYNENFMLPLGIIPNVSLRPDFIVMNYPVVSMHDSIAHRKSKRYLMGSQIQSKELENKLSLEDNVHSGMPPVFLMQAKGDKTVDYRNSVYFNRNMKNANLPLKFILYDCPGHGFGIDPKRNAIAAQWTEEFKKWMVEIGVKLYIAK